MHFGLVRRRCSVRRLSAKIWADALTTAHVTMQPAGATARYVGPSKLLLAALRFRFNSHLSTLISLSEKHPHPLQLRFEFAFESTIARRLAGYIAQLAC